MVYASCVGMPFSSELIDHHQLQKTCAIKMLNSFVSIHSVWLGLERPLERRHPGTASRTVAAQWEALAPQVALVPEVAQALAYQ